MFESIPGTIEYAKRPYGLLSLTNGRKRASASARAVLGAIWKNQAFKGTCNSTYEEFSKSLNSSRSTVARSLKTLTATGKIDKVSTSNYSVVLDKNIKSRGYILTPDFFYTSKITFKDNTSRFLTKPEIDVLSFVLSHTIKQLDPNGGIESTGKGYVGSVGNIGRLLCISTTTVKNVIETLLKAELIFRNATNESRNGTRYFRYVANTAIVKAMRKQMRKNKGEIDFESEEVKALNAETERQRFYSQRRDSSRREQEKKQHKLNNKIDYAILYREYRSNVLKIAKAEKNESKALEERQIEISRIMSEIARKMIPNVDLNEDGTVKARTICAKCHDTGYQSDDTMCDCWKEKRN